MSSFKGLERSAQNVKKSPRKGRKKQTRFIDVDVRSNIKDILKNMDGINNSLKSKVIKPALAAAAKLVKARAIQIIKANSHEHSPYGNKPPGDSEKTGTQAKWSDKVWAKRYAGAHDDLSKSIGIKKLPIRRRKYSPVVVIVGPIHKKFGFGHMLEFGPGGYTKPSSHWLWGKVNDIARIQARPFLEPAGKQTAKAQQRIIEQTIKDRWPQA